MFVRAVPERKENLTLREKVAPLAARPAGQLLIVHFAVKLFVLFSVLGKTLALARGSTLDSRRFSIYSKRKRAPRGNSFSFWSRRAAPNPAYCHGYQNPYFYPIFGNFLAFLRDFLSVLKPLIEWQFRTHFHFLACQSWTLNSPNSSVWYLCSFGRAI